jgi:hypothetical protein
MIAALLLVAAGCACAAGPAGIWAVRAEGRTIMLLTIRADPSAPAGWSADMVRPEGSAFTQTHELIGLGGPLGHRLLRAIAREGDRLLFAQATRGAGREDDIHTFRTIEGGLAEWGIKGDPIPPLLLAPARRGETVDFHLDPTHGYWLDEPWPSNAEMTRLFEEDQAARKGPAIDWSIVGPQDAARRARATALLEAGALRSGDDFWHAAFLFQHGAKPEDYLLAHGLAVIAAARGRRDAAWIAAATLDRYLQAIGQKQVYGTQYLTRPGQPVTQEPYDRTTLSDGMRSATGVPTLEWQEKQRAEMDAQRGPPPPPKR